MFRPPLFQDFTRFWNFLTTKKPNWNMIAIAKSDSR